MGRHGQGSGGQARMTIRRVGLPQAPEMQTEKPPAREQPDPGLPDSHPKRVAPTATRSHCDPFTLLPHQPCAHLAVSAATLGWFA